MTAPDISDSRDRVLARVRASLGLSSRDQAAPAGQAKEYVRGHSIGPQPEIPGSLVDRFEAQSLKLSASVARIPNREAAPQALAAYLQRLALPTQGVCWPSLAGLAWAEHGIELAARAPSRDDPKPDLLGVTGCFAAIAETGTLAMCSGPETPASMTLLPETHVALVPVSRIVAHMESVFALLRQEQGGLPRALNFISGPSRTADIEQTIVLGAHGPYRVHLLLIENE